MHLPAKTTDDLALHEDVTRPDFELADKYADLSKELTRLALLGIAGYGFLIKEVALKGNNDMPFLVIMAAHPFLMMAGLLLLGLAAASSLRCSQLSTNCLKFQVDIARFLKRRTSCGWNEEEHRQNEEELFRKRQAQGEVINKGRRALKVAVASLMIGTCLVVVDFATVLVQSSTIIKQQATMHQTTTSSPFQPIDQGVR